MNLVWGKLEPGQTSLVTFDPCAQCRGEGIIIDAVWRGGAGTLIRHVTCSADWPRPARNSHKMSTANTLKEILVTHSLDEESLKRKLSDEHRQELAKSVNDWKVVGSVIGFTQEQIKTIDDECASEEQKKTALFSQWTERYGEEATYFKLAELLFDGEQRDLLKELCSISSASTASG